MIPFYILKRYIHKRLLIENADNEQNDLFTMFGNLNKEKKSSEKISFLKNVKLLLKARENVPNSFKKNLFPVMTDTKQLIQRLEKHQSDHKWWKRYR